MESNEKIIYSINIEDVQNVSQRVFGKILNEKEMEIIENKIGDYIPWFEFIESAIEDQLNLERKGSLFDDEE
ncbi:hypothetical protein BH24ACI1_BH24ACI1_17200 [soil metagenome]|jgi:hypothetical protein